jgi:hypothetical protein
MHRRRASSGAWRRWDPTSEVSSLPQHGPHETTHETVKVLYIVGWGRSGSTIMDNLLGSLDGFFSAGELTYIWERGLVEKRRCGCGAPLLECEVWSRVLKTAFGDPITSSVAPSEAMRWQEELVRVRHTRRLLQAHRGPATNPSDLFRYTEVLSRLYRAIADVTGAEVIVDSSKRPSDAALLRLVPEVSPYYVQLVRDPRAVAYSWKRQKRQLDRGGRGHLSQHGALYSTFSWMGWNLAAEALRRRHDRERSMLLRYEDFVADPRAAIQSMAALVRVSPARVPIEGKRTALLAPNHTVSGNPSRFTTGSVELRMDDEWMARQRARDRALVTAVALPLLRRYDYPFVPHRA